MDCQNHGEAAILNERVLIDRPGVLCEGPSTLISLYLSLNSSKQSMTTLMPWWLSDAIYWGNPTQTTPKGTNLSSSGILQGLWHGKISPLYAWSGTQLWRIHSVLVLASFNPPSTVMFDSLILVEPPIYHPSAAVHHTVMYETISTITKRHDIWASRDEARTWFRKRFPWKAWDPEPEVLDAYVVSFVLPRVSFPTNSS